MYRHWASVTELIHKTLSITEETRIIILIETGRWIFHPGRLLTPPYSWSTTIGCTTILPVHPKTFVFECRLLIRMSGNAVGYISLSLLIFALISSMLTDQKKKELAPIWLEGNPLCRREGDTDELHKALIRLHSLSLLFPCSDSFVW